MRLYVHNMLICNVKTCVAVAGREGERPANFPLIVQPTAETGMVKKESEFNPDFIKHLLPRLDWTALALTARELGVAELPEKLPEELDESLLKAIHDLIMDIHIMEGKLVCRCCKREYPIVGGVPNMLLHEDEV